MSSLVSHNFFVIKFDFRGYSEKSLLNKLKSIFKRLNTIMVFIILEQSFTLLALINSELANLFVFIIMSTVHALLASKVRTFDNAVHAAHIVILHILVLEHFLAALVTVVALNCQTHKLAQ